MKTKNIHVAVFPIGSVIRLRKKNIKRWDGTSEYYKLIWALVRQKAISKVSLIQKSDWNNLTEEEKIEFDPRGVIYDVYSENNLRAPKFNKNLTREDISFIWKALKDKDLPDFGLGFYAQGLTTTNIPNFLYKYTNPNEFRQVLAANCNYAAPVLDYLNMSKINWYLILQDPRYLGKRAKLRDMYNVPKCILSQYNSESTITTIDKYEIGAPESEKNIKLYYTGIEKLNLINEKIISPETKRTNKFAIVAMQSSHGKNNINDYRYKILKKWFLDYKKYENNDIKIYGRWSEIFTKGYPQFKGFKESYEIDKIFENTRYTFIIPIKANWVTSKYAEMIRVGVVPFLHPDYDTQFNVFPKNSFIRVQNPDELYKKMKYLEENPHKRIELVKKLQEKYIKDAYRGEFLINILNKYNKMMGIDVYIPFEFDETILRKKSVTNLF